jgi:hypothetical protein
MSIRIFLFGFLLLCLPLFRQDFFVQHGTIFPLYFFLFPIGFIVMLWSVCSGRFKRLAVLVSVFAVVEAGLVGTVAYMAHYQRYAPLSSDYYYWVRELYGSFRNTTNFNSDLSRYDPTFGYRFKPGITGRFTNPEFDVEIKTNSLGVRDDEASVQHPPIVVLGDSHGMGWGVEHEQRFSEVMEKRLHLRVLNTAITSYGTHRETQLLGQVNLDSCKVVIIQYCDNDLLENTANLSKTQKSGIDTIGFVVAGRENRINRTYFPFKGIFLSLRWLINNKIKSAPKPDVQVPAKQVIASTKTKSEHADAFFPYLARIRARYKGPIVVFDLGVYNFPIVKEFEAYQAIHPADSVYFVNVHALLNRPDYFTIDDHINARGHAKIGVALADLIQKKEWLKRPE